MSAARFVLYTTDYLEVEVRADDGRVGRLRISVEADAGVVITSNNLEVRSVESEAVAPQ